MSGYGRSVPRTMRRFAQPRAVSASSREAREYEADIEQEARRFCETAPTFGFCGACGETVDEPRGKLHASDCPYLPAERRKAVSPAESGVAMTAGDVDAVIAIVLAEDLHAVGAR